MEFIDLKAQYSLLEKDIKKNINNVLESGQYMMGNYVKELEEKLADYVGTKYCITCANGTDALQLALMAWDIKQGDAVFVPTFTFYSTAEVVSILNATPIFVDCDERTFNMDPENLQEAIEDVIKEGKYTPKVIIPVDLFGLPADYNEIEKIAKKYNLLILEDGAQGFGGEINGNRACSFGDIATTSFFPAKPLGCYGDGGALFTNNKNYYELLNSLRVHGKGAFKYDNVRVGMNSRLDTLQAAILLPKLKAFEEYEVAARNKFANLYNDKLSEYVKIPVVPQNMVSSWAQYTILLHSEEERTFVQEKLKDVGIPTMIYYPKPLHKQEVYKDYNFNVTELGVSEKVSKTCLSLPMHPYMDEEGINFITSELHRVLKEFRNE